DEAGRCSRAQPFEPIGEGLLSSKDISDCAAERSEKSGDGARGSLLQRAPMDVAEPRRDAVALLEVLRVYGAFVDRLQVRNAAELYRVHGGRNLKVGRWQHARGPLHEIRPDRDGNPRCVSVAPD